MRVCRRRRRWIEEHNGGGGGDDDDGGGKHLSTVLWQNASDEADGVTLEED